ncbi:tRNA pseudouridine synthase Pus10 isoform X1 [Olea europaea subsp. europaea]|uniref:tRNA pseudouridine(55) synthase n=1 Tax=Olea europaea subsp. europaea TaxID=158383 RepID=A0A8S0SL26_OLEEU|nr:tRNA pseudouridine synthase Pus10 isoform X1 [Olea europaea subsp. europaea]
MADKDAYVNDGGHKVQVSPASASIEDDLKLIRDAARSLPPEAVKDLLSNGVCGRCIFWLFSIHRHILHCPSISSSVLSAILRESAETEGDVADHPNNLNSVEEFEEVEVCKNCLGIMQFVYRDAKEMLAKKASAIDFATTIADVVKLECHQIENFSLELSLPSIIVDNEEAIWLYMKKTYESKPWYHEKFPSRSITIKEFLRLSLTHPLEILLDVKSNPSSFHIRLTYKLSDASQNGQLISKGNECNKRRKIDDNDDLKKHANVHKVEEHEERKNSSNELGDHKLGCLTFSLEKVSRCCSLIIQCYRNSIYIGGRYLKYSRKVSQTRWIIDDERMGEASVEELVGGTILPICQGDSYKFHAAGREDIDVRMLGTGRPFLVEIQNARQVLSEALIKDIETKINSTETKYVRVKNLKESGSQGWALMHEGEAEKQYVAVVWISRPLDDNDVETVTSLKDMKTLQKTPVRVLHRRSSLVREKIIHWMNIERIAGSSQYFLLHLCSQAGTYIKEFVHGDLGRTHPSIGSILGCRAEILQLDVTDVKMDSFQI